MRLWLQVTGERIVEANFECRGCSPSIAAGSVLTEFIKGKTATEAENIAPAWIDTRLGGLPRNKRHAAALAIEALRVALAETSEEMS